MDWYVTTTGLISAGAAVIGLLSKLMTARSKSFRSKVVVGWQLWARTDVGRFWMKAYLEELKEIEAHEHRHKKLSDPDET